MWARVAGCAVACGLAALASCDRDDVGRNPAAVADGGDPEAGRVVAVEVGCHACHRIPGVRGADSYVGPPLDAWSRRSFIAGTLVNNAENLGAWLEDPDAIRPGTAMPDLDLEDSEIADLVAYLFTID
jgi:cytochrome c